MSAALLNDKACFGLGEKEKGTEGMFQHQYLCLQQKRATISFVLLMCLQY